MEKATDIHHVSLLIGKKKMHCQTECCDNLKRDIYTQLFYTIFGTTLSFIHSLYFYSFTFSFTFQFLSQMKKEKKQLSQNRCSNIIILKI
jgi:hypothetical protein